MSHDYLWAVYKDFDIFLVNTDNGNLSQLTNSPGYAVLLTSSVWAYGVCVCVCVSEICLNINA